MQLTTLDLPRLGCVRRPPHRGPGTGHERWNLVVVADTVKLFLLAAFVASATSAVTRSHRVPAWLRAISWPLVVLLQAGGAAFVVDSSLKTALWTVSLPLLCTTTLAGVRASTCSVASANWVNPRERGGPCPHILRPKLDR